MSREAAPNEKIKITVLRFERKLTMRNNSQSPYESFMRQYREFERRIEKAEALKDLRRQRTKKEHVMKTNEIHSVRSIFKTDYTMNRLKADLNKSGRPPPIYSHEYKYRIQCRADHGSGQAAMI